MCRRPPNARRSAARPGRERPSGIARLAVALLVVSTAAACTGTSRQQVEVGGEADGSAEPTTTTTRPPDCADMLPPAAKAGQLVMVMVTAPQVATEVLSSGRAGGLGLKGRQSSEVADEVTAAIADTPLPALVASDEEGGDVQRLGAALGPLPSAESMGEGTPVEAGQLVGDYARKMVEAGFNMNFGPVADVGEGADLGSRTFGDDPQTVGTFVEAVVDAQEGAGLVSVVKHWPGIGGAEDDPHLSLSTLASVDQLRSSDMVPFERALAAGARGVMIAHAEVPGLTAEGEPASLSRAAITDELRGRQGFDGLVITDSLGMGAIVNTTNQPDAAERAIAAGADIALVSGTDVVPEVHAQLTQAISSGRIPPDQVTASVRRVLSAKGVEGQCLDAVAAFSTLQQETGSPAGGGTDAPDSTDGTGTSGQSTSSTIPDSGING